MNKYDALVITGKLEVRFKDNDDLLKLITDLQKFIAEGNIINAAITIGKISEITNDSELSSLQEFICSNEALTEKNNECKGSLSKSISDLKFSVRTHNCLLKAGKESLADLVSMSMDDFYHVRNLGKKGVDEIIAKLNELGFGIKTV